MIARDDAARIVAQARGEAEAVRVAARVAADEIREAARREGEAAGVEQAAAIVVRARIDAAREAAAQTDTVVTLALDVAHTILGREAASGPDVLRDVAKRALQRVRRARRIVLRVNPADANLATQQLRAWLPAGTEPDSLGVEVDPSVEPGGVVIESDLGRIDARLEKQLDAIAHALRTPS